MIIIVLLLLTVTAAAVTCPSGYSYYGMTQKCYKVYNDASPYFAAFNICQHDGGSLVSIHNAFENTYIADLVSNNNLDHWIGLTNMISGYDFEWLDNSPVKYTNWIPGEPNYDTSCVFMEAASGYWASNNCRDFLPFICEYDPASAHNPVQSPATCPPSPKCPTCATCPPEKTCPTAPQCPTSAPKPLCDAGWKYYDSTESCYLMGNDKPINNTVAQNLCKQQDADLTSIHSQAENDFIVDYIQSLTTPDAVWIGLYRTGPGPEDFGNYDGTPVGYTNWANGQPDNGGGHEFCVQMCMSTNVNASWCAQFPCGKWNDITCLDTVPVYICKKPANKL